MINNLAEHFSFLYLKVSSALPNVTNSIFSASSNPDTAWWVWPVLLFFTTFILGIIAVLAGVGGGVLFVPIVGTFFPFHLDFVRGAGLIVALAGALAAGPSLLIKGLANLRLALPVALIASSFSIIGAFIGLALPQDILQVAMGVTICAIAALFIFSKDSDIPNVPGPDKIARRLNISGTYVEESTGKQIKWTVWRTAQGYLAFILIGLIAGMFGLGAGWANVPVLNLLMGAPLKLAVGSSKFLLSITDTSAAWIYLNKGAVLPIITIPSVIGIMLGSLVGVRLLSKSKPKAVRYLVIFMLLFAGINSMIKGLGII
ncbi:sulfite exporter TauE/SafE family protein [Desulfofalx alkaliphila]|uniref:sulfite exporter TauE/SafE family protein n=1 Tax=Desulfofalx alkaliphila TaxID=105483 RepID=UPI0004E0BB00|nr:sulfite exporter TauE/SafE family protein [Desulfofalx alkaliphila]